MNDGTLRSLHRMLWPDADAPQGPQVHWLIDGARVPGIVDLLGSSGLAHTCLFTGQLHPRLLAAAPYLVHLPPGAAAAAQLLRQSWGHAWGIFIVTEPDVSLAQLCLHLKKFLRVTTERGETLAFRYYDPRVLNVFLPTCIGAEFKNFFGPISRFVVESDAAQVREFVLHGDAMQIREYPLA